MFEYFMYSYGNQIIGLILYAIFGCIGNACRKIYQNHINDETKRSIARAVVQFVEQAWKSLHGEEKLCKALETAQKLLSAKGIDFDAREMEVLIEAAVAEFNEAFKKPLVDTPTAEATRRVEETANV